MFILQSPAGILVGVVGGLIICAYLEGKKRYHDYKINRIEDEEKL